MSLFLQLIPEDVRTELAESVSEIERTGAQCGMPPAAPGDPWVLIGATLTWAVRSIVELRKSVTENRKRIEIIESHLRHAKSRGNRG